MGVGKETIRIMAQEHASDVLKRRWPKRYIGKPIVSMKDCISGLIEIGAMTRETVELTSKEAALSHWLLNRLEAKNKSELVDDNSFYRSNAWRKLRYSILREQGARCSACGSSAKDGVTLHVDHIKPRSKFPDLALEPTNLQVLCEDCNIGKSDGEAVSFR